jgi:peptidoglycan/xylan/chitin deacetylase (PgdA/CDA1 family)
MSNPLKKAALSSFRSLGLFSLSTRLKRADTLVILCYHGISVRDEHEWSGGLYITPDFFRRRLEFLRSWNASVLPLSEALARLHAGSLPPRSVVLTFDDGFYDFYLHAFPALRDFGYPCTVYLTTWYSRFRLPIFNLMLNYLLWKSAPPGFATREERDKFVVAQMQKVASQNLDAEGADRIARSVAQDAGIDYDALIRDRMFQIMSPEEVSAISSAGIDIQLHTHRHRTPSDRELFLREIRDNSSCIAEMTGRVPSHFCYPSGVTAPAFLPWLREAGVESATTCVHGLARANSEPLLIPRYLDGCGVTELDFESWLSGVR